MSSSTDADAHLPVGERNIGRRTPESLIGGFSRRDSTFLFYSLINSVLKPEFVILDFGAGRGAQGETRWTYKRDLLNFKGRVARIVGVDVDPAVMENPMLDEAAVYVPGDPLPYPDASFDLIFSDWVLEHVDDGELFAAEIKRLLKPGGWFFGRTPNRNGLIALGASVIPNVLHARVLKRLQPDRNYIDIFPTRYRMNTPGAIRKLFSASDWDNYTTTLDTEFMYLASRKFLFEIAERVSRAMPSVFRPVLLVCLKKH